MYYKAISTIILLMSLSNGGDSCMCMPSHPQQQLCSEGTFAALVKIRSKEYVYTIERPKSSSSDGISNNELTAKDIKEIEAYDYEKDAGKRHHISQKPEMERVEIVVKDLGHLSPKHYVASHVRYRVKVYETYKGLNAQEVQGKKMYIYTAPDEGLCGVELTTKDMYMLIGYVTGEQLSIGTCSHVVSWNKLDAKQKRSVRRNMRNTKQTCDSKCEVKTCSWFGCPDAEEKECVWTSDMERSNRKLGVHPANYVCAPAYGKQGKSCEWTNSLSTNKRRRRRRRHHFSVESVDPRRNPDVRSVQLVHTVP